ncbi:MAG TPA: phosphoribosylaminoimidazole carboxylase, partial [Thermoplasmata archaeon]|nr:phosphoribosylaminoimidazole carboxylase [Thermoplasmata archaeon]
MARARPSPNRRIPVAEIRVGRFARVDRDRPRRVGVPEVVLGEGKTVEHVVSILRELHRSGSGAIVSRPSVAQLRAVDGLIAEGLPLRVRAEGRVVRLDGPLGADYRPGVVALLTAGTSDVLLAEESRAVLEELGIQVTT